MQLSVKMAYGIGVRWHLVAWIVVGTVTPGMSTVAQPPQEEATPAASLPNWKVPTLGGKQFWTDHQWRRGWRIQRHAITGHWRLIDDRNVRQAWGSRAACDAVLSRKVPDPKLPSEHAIVLLHGLMRSADSMSRIGESLADATGDSIVMFEYASTRASITDHAAALREVIAGLPDGISLSFVGHSMGNIVVRHAIGDWQRAEEQQTLDRIKHVVMLGPPNQGSSIARQLAKTGVLGWITGNGGLELGPRWQEFESRLAVPHCPFGVIAGHLPESIPQNPLVDGQGDFIVSVDETRLPGAADFLEVPRMHTFLMDDPAVQRAVAAFLDHNRFE